MQTSSPTQSRPSSEETNTSSGYGTTPQSSSSNGKRMGGKKCQEKKTVLFLSNVLIFLKYLVWSFFGFLAKKKMMISIRSKKKVWPKILDAHDRHSKITLFLPFIVWKWNGSRANKWWKKSKNKIKLWEISFLGLCNRVLVEKCHRNQMGKLKKIKVAAAAAADSLFLLLRNFVSTQAWKKRLSESAIFFRKQKKIWGNDFLQTKLRVELVKTAFEFGKKSSEKEGNKHKSKF